ncbi:MAG: hypothetical protein PHX70_10335 [Clostridium sp.]|nr:hypothetical protein [Clostridium sp.]
MFKLIKPRKQVAIVFAVLLLLVSSVISFPVNVSANTNSLYVISILVTADIHDHVLNYMIKLLQKPPTIQGTPLSYYFDKIDTNCEYPLLKVMGAMKYDTWTLGNHEFNYVLTTLNRIIADANKENINVLSANTYKTDNTNFVKPYYIKNFNINGKTIKVGILGLTTKCIPDWGSFSLCWSSF